MTVIPEYAYKSVCLYLIIHMIFFNLIT